MAGNAKLLSCVRGPRGWAAEDRARYPGPYRLLRGPGYYASPATLARNSRSPKARRRLRAVVGGASAAAGHSELAAGGRRRAKAILKL
jgi:hypothetical protein